MPFPARSGCLLIATSIRRSMSRMDSTYSSSLRRSSGPRCRFSSAIRSVTVSRALRSAACRSAAAAGSICAAVAEELFEHPPRIVFKRQRTVSLLKPGLRSALPRCFPRQFQRSELRLLAKTLRRY